MPTTDAIDELLDYILAHGPYAGFNPVDGTNAWAGGSNPSPDQAMWLVQDAGMGVVEVMGGATLPALELPEVGVRYRDGSWDNGRAVIRAVYRTLAPLTETTLDGVHYLRVASKMPPFLMVEDENKRFVWACSFDVTKERSP